MVMVLVTIFLMLMKQFVPANRHISIFFNSIFLNCQLPGWHSFREKNYTRAVIRTHKHIYACDSFA